MTFVVVSIIYAGTVLLCVGTVAWIVRAWTPKAQKPERLALHCRWRGAACERRNWSVRRFANRAGAWLYGVRIGLAYGQVQSDCSVKRRSGTLQTTVVCGGMLLLVRGVRWQIQRPKCPGM